MLGSGGLVDDEQSGEPITAVHIPPNAARQRKASQVQLRAARYRIDDVLGEGATSIVHAAFDTFLERDVALKELKSDAALAPAVLLREGKVLAAVQHPNVVVLLGVHVERGGKPFLVMERVAGTTLGRVMAEERRTLRQRIDILRQAAAGLDAVHRAGLVHGDVKPANVLVDPYGRVKIADFGIVPLLERMSAGEILGTPAYMSPERASGVALERGLGPKSDVYSFGVVAMQLLTGRLPFLASGGAELLAAHRNVRPRRPSEVAGLSRAFDEPIVRALEKSPLDRPRSCSAIVDGLERALLGADRQGAPLRVLVADDDADQRALLSTMLRTELTGAVIQTVPDGDSALESIRARAPTVAVLDLSMPGLCGIGLLRAVRTAAPAAALVVVTGHGSGPEWQEARSLGAQRFLVKPVEQHDLVRAIREVVDGPAPVLSRATPTEIRGLWRGAPGAGR